MTPTTGETTHNLFFGAGAMAYGMGNAWGKRQSRKMGGGGYFKWTEKLVDYDNEEGIGSAAIFGMQKSRYTPDDGSAAADYGVIRYDTLDIAHA